MSRITFSSPFLPTPHHTYQSIIDEVVARAPQQYQSYVRQHPAVLGYAYGMSHCIASSNKDHGTGGWSFAQATDLNQELGVIPAPLPSIQEIEAKRKEEAVRQAQIEAARVAEQNRQAQIAAQQAAERQRQAVLAQQAAERQRQAVLAQQQAAAAREAERQAQIAAQQREAARIAEQQRQAIEAQRQAAIQLAAQQQEAIRIAAAQEAARQVELQRQAETARIAEAQRLQQAQAAAQVEILQQPRIAGQRAALFQEQPQPIPQQDTHAVGAAQQGERQVDDLLLELERRNPNLHI